MLGVRTKQIEAGTAQDDAGQDLPGDRRQAQSLCPEPKHDPEQQNHRQHEQRLGLDLSRHDRRAAGDTVAEVTAERSPARPYRRRCRRSSSARHSAVPGVSIPSPMTLSPRAKRGWPPVSISVFQQSTVSVKRTCG